MYFCAEVYKLICYQIKNNRLLLNYLGPIFPHLQEYVCLKSATAVFFINRFLKVIYHFVGKLIIYKIELKQLVNFYKLALPVAYCSGPVK
jgi:hypothetical protein